VDVTRELAARAIECMRRVAADEILPRYRTVAAIRKDDGSLVTEADLAAQHALVAGLPRIDDIPVLGEEMGAAEQARIFERSERFWCVDPLDGTKNFSDGVPFFAVSVALMEGARPAFGAVYDPIADEAFHAVRGAGAWLDHRALTVPPRGPALAQALAEVSLRRDAAGLRGALKHRAPYARRLTSGSSTLSWCHLAAGRIDVMLHSGQKMWDYAAGALILEEAGGFACTLEHDDFWAAAPWSRSVVAARTQPLLHSWRDWIRGEIAAP
jgi:myo-inositol-1(or 4)-monophosphatase